MSPSAEPQSHPSIAERFDQRAIRLRRQANIFLAIIIVVLVGGAAAFVFANDITNLTLRPQTAEAQYAAAVAALKQNEENQTKISKEIRVINNSSSVHIPFNERVTPVIAELASLLDNTLQKCTNITRIVPEYIPTPEPGEYIPPEAQVNSYDFSKLFSVAVSDRIGEFRLLTPDRTVFFSNEPSAVRCKDQLSHVEETFTKYLRQIQDISRERQAAANKYYESKRGEIAPFEKRLRPLSIERLQLEDLVKEVERRVTQERVLGAPLTPGKRDPMADKSDGKTDWARVIEINATRIGALAIMFFLVTILVPQYRYNIRLASFYEARSDSITFLPDSDVRIPDDLDKIVSIMTPNIDFGKAPPTPWEHIIDLIKTAKS